MDYFDVAELWQQKTIARSCWGGHFLLTAYVAVVFFPDIICILHDSLLCQHGARLKYCFAKKEKKFPTKIGHNLRCEMLPAKQFRMSA